MAEYIEREAAVDVCRHAWAKGLEPSQYIEELPAADVAPVRHGRWIGERGDYTCNVCGCEGPEDGGYWASPFCPCCGAKMDLEGGDGD